MSQLSDFFYGFTYLIFHIAGLCQRVDLSVLCLWWFVLDNFLRCDWSMRFMQVILLVSHWSESVYSLNLYWGQGGARIQVYRDWCLEAGINRSITVPSKMCAPQVASSMFWRHTEARFFCTNVQRLLNSLCVQQNNWSKHSVCATSLDENAVGSSNLLGSTNARKGGDLNFQF